MDDLEFDADVQALTMARRCDAEQEEVEALHLAAGMACCDSVNEEVCDETRAATA